MLSREAQELLDKLNQNEVKATDQSIIDEIMQEPLSKDRLKMLFTNDTFKKLKRLNKKEIECFDSLQYISGKFSEFNSEIKENFDPVYNFYQVELRIRRARELIPIDKTLESKINSGVCVRANAEGVIQIYDKEELLFEFTDVRLAKKLIENPKLGQIERNVMLNQLEGEAFNHETIIFNITKALSFIALNEPKDWKDVQNYRMYYNKVTIPDEKLKTAVNKKINNLASVHDTRKRSDVGVYTSETQGLRRDQEDHYASGTIEIKDAESKVVGSLTDHQIVRALQYTAKDLHKKLKASQPNVKNQGTTLSSVFFHNNNIYNMNIGDSFACMAIRKKDGTISVIPLTKKLHDPAMNEEQERLNQLSSLDKKRENIKLTIARDKEDIMKVGVASCSRSLGDQENFYTINEKKNEKLVKIVNENWDAGFFCVPDVTKTSVPTLEEGDRLILLNMCDGALEAATKKAGDPIVASCDYLRSTLEKTWKDNDAKAEDVIESIKATAFADGSNDNITVMGCELNSETANKNLYMVLADGHGGSKVSQFAVDNYTTSFQSQLQIQVGHYESKTLDPDYVTQAKASEVYLNHIFKTKIVGLLKNNAQWKNKNFTDLEKKDQNEVFRSITQLIDDDKTKLKNLFFSVYTCLKAAKMGDEEQLLQGYNGVKNVLGEEFNRKTNGPTLFKKTEQKFIFRDAMKPVLSKLEVISAMWAVKESKHPELALGIK